MSWSDRRQFLSAIAALAALPACGFRPALAPQGGAGALRGRVRADTPEDAQAFALVERLEDRLGRPGAGADLRLAYAIETATRSVGVNPEGVATRIQIAGSVRFELTDADGAVRLSDTVRGFTAWSTTADGLATEIASEDARRRLMVILADAIVTRLYVAGAEDAATGATPHAPHALPVVLNRT